MTATSGRRLDTLLPRILSALVMVPAALAAVWFGLPWLAILVGLAGVAMAWEWARLTGIRPALPGNVLVIATAALAIAAAAAERFALALGVAVVGALAAGLLRGRAWPWRVGGTLWIAAGCVAFLWLSLPAHGGRITLFALLGVVWATDIFAYLTGKTFGGPRLAPRVSPNKTWAGLAGGLSGGVAAGLIAALAIGAPVVSGCAVSLFLSIVAQGGDLAESWAKRHFAVKDTSGLIPGHGGALDRLDGLLAASIAAALLTLAAAGRALHM